jgi:hypothetical protein
VLIIHGHHPRTDIDRLLSQERWTRWLDTSIRSLHSRIHEIDGICRGERRSTCTDSEDSPAVFQILNFKASFRSKMKANQIRIGTENNRKMGRKKNSWAVTSLFRHKIGGRETILPLA